MARANAPGAPPDDVSPAELFRLLCEVPRARWPLKFRLPGAEDVPLDARAITAAEESAIFGAGTGLPEERRRARVTAELLRGAVWTPGGPLFASLEDVGRLFDDEAPQLARQVREALAIISPSYGRSDVRAWSAVLREGARAPESLSLCITLGASVDLSFGAATPRPDRFFGLPGRELTDSHWLAFGAARAVLDEMSKSNGK